MLGIHETTTKKTLIVSPYDVEDRPPLVYPGHPNFNMEPENNDPVVDVPIDLDYAIYDLR